MIPTTTSAPQEPIPPTSTVSSSPALDAIAAAYLVACRAPGAAVGTENGDGTVSVSIAGELASGRALTADSQFLAGSVTKLFVATVALQLIAEHQLSMTDTIDRFLPGWPSGDRITVEMLLGHRSGMGDFGNDFGAELRDLVLADLSRVFHYDEVLDLVRAVPPVAEPGTTYHYTNAGYIVLGAILQQVTGRSLGQLMQERIIGPLGLEHTIYGPDDLDAAAEIELHGLFDVTGDGNAIDIAGLPVAAALTVDPAGAGVISTLRDLLTFTQSLFGTDRLLGTRERAELRKAVSTLDSPAVLLPDAFDVIGHGGASPGAQVMVAHDVAHATTAVVWCNRLDPGAAELDPSLVALHDTLELLAGG